MCFRVYSSQRHGADPLVRRERARGDTHRYAERASRHIRSWLRTTVLAAASLLARMFPVFDKDKKE